MIELTVDLLAKADTVAAMCDTNDVDFACDLLRDWVKDNPDEAVKVMLVLADLEQRIRDGHADYNRGERDEVTEELERRYNTRKAARARSYRKRQRSAPARKVA